MAEWGLFVLLPCWLIMIPALGRWALRDIANEVKGAVWLAVVLVSLVVLWAALNAPTRNDLAWLIGGGFAFGTFLYVFAVLGPWTDVTNRIASVVSFTLAVGSFVMCWAIIYQRAAAISGCFASGFSHHIDSLYFALTTFTTVGFGQPYAKGPTCRWLVSGQVVLDLVILGVAVAVLIVNLTNDSGPPAASRPPPPASEPPSASR
jgi:hypothetical protein